jgi:3-oxoacyl-[acyl-carrier-protein] synthase III
MMKSRVGIRGIGLSLPPAVRTNDWWPQATVDRWMEARRRAPAGPAPSTPGEQMVFDAMKAQAIDPFQGTNQRHILAPELGPIDLEEQAARLALSNAGVSVSEIDLLLTYTAVPDSLMGNPACGLHYRLGLPIRCFAMHVDAAAYSFIMQLSLAESMIASGRASTALLVQSSVCTRAVDPEDPISVLFGDGATAVVVAKVGETRGIVSTAHFADGALPKTLIASVPGKRWYDGTPKIHIADGFEMQKVFLQTADACKTSVETALSQIGATPADVDFLASHQGTPWMRDAVSRHVGLANARFVDLFDQTAYLAAAFVPACMLEGANRGLLRDGDLVVMTGGGTGMTYGAVAMHWGAGA